MRNFRFSFFNILSIIFIIYGIGLFILSGYTVGTLMIFCLGAVFFFFDFSKRRLEKNKIAFAAKIIITIGLLIIAGLIIFIIFSAGVFPSDKNEDAVIVLGCGLDGSEVSDTLKKRLDACVDYIGENSKAVIVVSGGQGLFEEIPEAVAMEKYLVENGVKNKIIKEANSSSTYENFVNSKKLLDDYFKEKNADYKTAFITNRFHCYRAYNLAKNAGMSVSCFPAGDEWKSAFPSYLRETLAVIKLWLIGK